MSTPTPAVTMRVLPELYVICQLEPGQPVQLPDSTGSLYALTRTTDEVSLVCIEDDCPRNTTKLDAGWSALVVEGQMDFSLTGILASIAGPLAAAGIPIFAISTYDTDYVLVRTVHLPNAIKTLGRERHTIKH